MPHFVLRPLRTARLAVLGSLGALALLATTIAPAAAASPVSTCTAMLHIFTTSVGTERVAGPVLIFTNSGVGGQYTSGFLMGYTITGAQDIVLNTRTNQSDLAGQFVASGPGGTLTVRYVGHADLNTGAATGHFVATRGTGRFSDFVWEGPITARLVGPTTFDATDTGACFGLR